MKGTSLSFVNPASTTLVESEIAAIGHRMVRCTKDCIGASTWKNGTPSRCLFLERRDDDERGVVVVGLNPGRAPPDELRSYASRADLYAATVEYLGEKSKLIPYYERMRDAVGRMGFQRGSILWTEVAKCELLCGQVGVPIEMRRTCGTTYLTKELAACPQWPIVAVGQQSFEAVSYLVPERAVIGVPHPTGAWGKAFERATGNKRSGFPPTSLAKMNEALALGSAVWLSSRQA